jgi:pyridoxamine 5'-phosphate oxidase-like protein
MNWTGFATASSRLAALGVELMDRHGLVLLGSLRRDGWPRISPVEPLVVDGELVLGMIWQSKKALDLLRDPRCHLHTVVTDRNGTEGEWKAWGRAHALERPARDRYADALYLKIGWRPNEPFHAFAIDLESVAYRRFGGAGGKVVALVWKAGAETVESEVVVEV